MRPPTLIFLAAFLIVIGAVISLKNPVPTPADTSKETAQTPSVAGTATSSKSEVTSSTTKATFQHPSLLRPRQKASSSATSSSPITGPSEITRIESPYSTSPLSFEEVNGNARAAIVNIVCESRSGSMNPISGSGVFIDPRGVILTNAHVAQYVLLSESPDINLDCTIRNDSPAIARFRASVLYIPSIWVSTHAAEINMEHPPSTGEHDYALLFVTGMVNGASIPSSFPYLPPDTREAVAFRGDELLVASYPAEFVGGDGINNQLYSASSVTTAKELITFGSTTLDLLSLGGVIEAQGGSSGGAIVNAWSRLVGIIATTTTAPTTGERDLHAITLSYIDRDIKVQSGKSLETILSDDPLSQTKDFIKTQGSTLVQTYLKVLNSE